MRLIKTRRRKVRVHWPVTSATFTQLIAASGAVAYLGGDIEPLRDVIEATAELGDFGDYTDVVEMSIGYETFSVGPAANPTLGSAGERSVSPTLVVTTYMDSGISDERVEEILARLVAAHPWEVPVIELTDAVELVTPSASARMGVHA